MFFGSMKFIYYFLPVFFLAYGLTPKEYKNLTLLAGSLFFYAQGKPVYLIVILVVSCLNFYLGLKLEPAERRRNKKDKEIRGNNGRKKNRCLFVFAVAGNAVLLCYFKWKGGEMPLGLSFYTFQAISYLADVYRGEIPCERNLSRFLVYLLMFPKVSSGPIVAYGDMRKDLESRRVTAEGFQSGLKMLAVGLAMKVLLADRLGYLWNDLMVTGYESITWKLAWIGALAYSFKLYFDFHGYSLMALGLGRMVGFHLPENFRLPYLSGSVREFYRRWHITLGTWFRKYIYIPLGGSRRGAFRTAVNLLVVWFLTGFWHGTSLNYLIWGMLLGACVILERGFSRLFPRHKPGVLSHLYLWFVIPISWMCFAITDLSQLQIYLCRMFGIGDAVNANLQDWYLALRQYWVYLAAGLLCSLGVVEWAVKRWKNKLWMNLLLAAVFWYCTWLILTKGDNPFMYINF